MFTKRFYVVLDVEDNYTGSTEDVALWVDHALGQTRQVESEVFESFEDLAETERLNDEFQPALHFHELHTAVGPTRLECREPWPCSSIAIPTVPAAGRP